MRDFTRFLISLPAYIKFGVPILLAFLILYESFLVKSPEFYSGAFKTGVFLSKIALSLTTSLFFYIINVHYKEFKGKRKLAYYVNGRLNEICNEAVTLAIHINPNSLPNPFPEHIESFQINCQNYKLNAKTGSVPDLTYEELLIVTLTRTKTHIKQLFFCNNLEAELINLIGRLISSTIYKRIDGYFPFGKTDNMSYYAEDIFHYFKIVDAIDAYRLKHIKEFMKYQDYQFAKDKVLF